MGTSDKVDVTAVTIDTERAELRLEFEDGAAGAIQLSDLRQHCPCATCRAARQAGRPAWTSLDGAPPTVRDARLVGAWGLGITWGDGHATGIYPFESLHEWVSSGRVPFLPDSGLGG